MTRVRTVRNDSGRYQTQQQLTRIKNGWFSRSCALPSWIIWSAALCLILWTLNLIFGLSVDDTTRGTFGDTFGAVNSIFSALALLGVAWSIFQQRQQLDQTREELDVAKADRDETRQIFKDQQNNLKKERFETTFFQLFTALQNLTDTLVASSTQNPSTGHSEDVRGKGVFKTYLKELCLTYKETRSSAVEAEMDGVTDLSELEIPLAHLGLLEESYSKFFDNHGSEIGRYYRSLYTIINYVDTASIEENEKYFYCKLLRAQLTTHESGLLAINMISGKSTDAFNDIICKYGMAKNADQEEGIVGLFLLSIPFAAFGRSYVNGLISQGALPNVHGASSTFEPLENRPDCKAPGNAW
jgi:hypothetical protein